MFVEFLKERWSVYLSLFSLLLLPALLSTIGGNNNFIFSQNGE
jgi:hypothetical protein